MQKNIHILLMDVASCGVVRYLALLLNKLSNIIF